ncbi:phage tail assembly chaperone [Pseudomonas sichuanensis]|uniref:phage tail assembly chaperone n=1 Tax=Pseudomonas sichuanensis TaxID=2213015 RepID=UPI00244B77BC|nr:phage tail assembly chaperone [Pseudomonas sichuanensis]MDH0730990.1 phage tail assembly chaperone [Pseudomonas sichuanensis]MDH1581033.1 phage tail assembly chaperone [Pseudomonas sichuanensis]MDH1591106.1 phage tail assembly chaperone [Pseudomonas sichuanensis]MDH1596775.1 phage tail assembly chaperone [Pseudomonas sichuanensis]
MPFVQRDDSGRVCGRFANRQEGYAEEWLDDNHLDLIAPDGELQANNERAWRDSALAAVMWLRDRHRDQVEGGAATTLTAEQFQELLAYMQALRDWPQSEAFPDSAQRPVAPPWIAEQSQ